MRNDGALERTGVPLHTSELVDQNPGITYGLGLFPLVVLNLPVESSSLISRL